MSDESRAARDEAMARYLAAEDEKPAPRKPAPKPAKKPAQKPVAKKPAPAPRPQIVEREVPVGPSFWTIVRAVVVGQIIFAVMVALYWSVFVRPERERDLRCAIENTDRALAGQEELACD